MLFFLFCMEKSIIILITHVTHPDADSGVYPVLLSFPRKRESMSVTDSCFRRNDRVRNMS
jgi:hypothetical protein